MPSIESLASYDPEIHAILAKELNRQRNCLELIASENLVSPAVMELAGSVFTNKYAEGYPSKRYYGGCQHMDEVEACAQRRAKKLFEAQYANVQPHSGSQANMGAYAAVMTPGDLILGMNLAHGGHLTHGSHVNFSGKLYKATSYGVNRETETIDYGELRQMALKMKPRVILAGASAYPRSIDFAKFREIADEAGALLIVDMAHIAGLVATGLHPSPIPHAAIVTTTTHKTLRGPRGGMILVGQDRENDMGITAPKSGRMKRIGELIDSAVFPGIQGGPLMHIIAAKALALKEAAEDKFAVYQKKVLENAKNLAKILITGNIRVITGGTDNHLLLLDLSPLAITGKEAETWLEFAGMTVNKNIIPFDPLPPQITSGIRIGTPAVTTRGMGIQEMEVIARYMIDALKSGGDRKILKGIEVEVKRLCDRFPIYEEFGNSFL